MGCIASKLVTAEKAAEALKDALKIAIREAVAQLGAEGGFRKSKFRIENPGNLSEVLEKLSALPGMAEELAFGDNMNAAAEAALKDSETILKDLVDALDFEDAMKVLEGDVDAAVQHLRKSLEPKLIEDLTPVVQAKLEEGSAFSLYERIKKALEAIPFNSTKIDVDVAEHTVKNAVDALFQVMTEVEEKIRNDKELHETEAMKEAFGQMMTKKTAMQKVEEKKGGEKKEEEETKEEEKKEEEKAE